jgi:hypothetical protein
MCNSVLVSQQKLRVAKEFYDGSEFVLERIQSPLRRDQSERGFCSRSRDRNQVLFPITNGKFEGRTTREPATLCQSPNALLADDLGDYKQIDVNRRESHGLHRNEPRVVGKKSHNASFRPDFMSNANLGLALSALG